MAGIELDRLAGKEGGRKSERLAKHWLEQIIAVREDTRFKTWVKRAEEIEKRYRDERIKGDSDQARHYNALWSNTEILRPALYGQCPIALAERRFKDKDPVGRAAATMLERALRNEVEVSGFDRAMRQAVTDFLLPGRGVVWVRYEPEIEDGTSLPPETRTDLDDDQGADDEDTEENTVGLGENLPPVKQRFKSESFLQPEVEDDDPESLEEEEAIEKLHSTGDRILRESTPVDYVPWRDFWTLPLRARSWAEVTTVVKRVYMSKDELRHRFGKDIGDAIPLKKDDRGEKKISTTAQNLDEDKGQIYEVWDASTKKVYWVAEGYEFLCDLKVDPLNLQFFFPVPEPLYANSTNETLIPVPEYMEYQDQAIQIDELTQRIAMLTKACKVAGLYNAAAKDIQRLFQEGFENQLIPVDDWAAFGDGGGVEGNMAILPIDAIIKTINELMMVKQKQIEEMDRLTGISDIMRGTTDARETLGAVRIKTNTSGTRISSRQNEVARFARDTIRIMADIVCQHFTPKSIIEASGALYVEGLGPDDMPKLVEAHAMMQGEGGMPPQGQPQLPGPPGGAPPMGNNVVPFARPGLPAPPPPQMGAPAAPPAPPMGVPPPPMGGQPPMGGPPPLNGQVIPPMPPQQPGPPQMDPQLKAKMEGLQRIMKGIQLLRDERLLGFRVEIDTDSTIFGDQAQEKQDRTEFIKSITGFLQIGAQMGEQMPESLPLLAKLLQFGVRGYRVGRDLETAVEEFCDEAMSMAGAAKQKRDQQPDYAAQKAEAEIKKTNAQADSFQASAQTDLMQGQSDAAQAQTDAMQAQSDVQIANLQLQSDREQAAAEVQRQQVENQGEANNAAMDLQMKQIDMRMKEMEQEIAAAHLKLEEWKTKQLMKKPLVPKAPAK